MNEGSKAVDEGANAVNAVNEGTKAVDEGASDVARGTGRPNPGPVEYSDASDVAAAASSPLPIITVRSHLRCFIAFFFGSISRSSCCPLLRTFTELLLLFYLLSDNPHVVPLSRSLTELFCLAPNIGLWFGRRMETRKRRKAR